MIGRSSRVLSGHMPRPRKPTPHASPTALHLFEVAPGFGAGLVQVFERRARQFELAGGFEADRAVGAAHGDDLAAFLDRLPAELPHGQQDVADAAGLVVGRGVDDRRSCRRASRARCRCASARAASRPPASARPAGRGFRSAAPRPSDALRVLIGLPPLAASESIGQRKLRTCLRVSLGRPSRPPPPSTAR